MALDVLKSRALPLFFQVIKDQSLEVGRASFEKTPPIAPSFLKSRVLCLSPNEAKLRQAGTFSHNILSTAQGAEVGGNSRLSFDIASEKDYLRRSNDSIHKAFPQSSVTACP